MMKLDERLLQLILFCLLKDVLDNSADDFENGEDVFEAIGALLQEVDAQKSEDEVM